MAMLTIVGVAMSIFAQQAAFTPKAGSKERKAILDALRAPVEKSLKGKKVEFKINHFKVKDGWAFINAEPQAPGGKKIDYRGTQYQEAIDAEVFDNNVGGLLKLVKGKWQVKSWWLGATDVPWDGWWDKYKAPRSIFPQY